MQRANFIITYHLREVTSRKANKQIRQFNLLKFIERMIRSLTNHKPSHGTFTLHASDSLAGPSSSQDPWYSAILPFGFMQSLVRVLFPPSHKLLHTLQSLQIPYSEEMKACWLNILYMQIKDRKSSIVIFM